MRLLIVEDSKRDTLLLTLHLRSHKLNFTFERVDNSETMKAALARGPWDAVISDYIIPGFGALDALELVKRLGLDLPFIIISGAVSEEVAVEAMKSGAHDFMSKSALGRLVPALEREVREAKNRAEKRSAEEQAKQAHAAALLAQAKAAATLRLSILADVSKGLASSLDIEEVLGQLDPIFLTGLSDGYIVELIERQGSASRVVINARGLEKQALAKNQLMEAMDSKTPLIIPLRARGEVLGAVTLVRGKERPPYSQEDQAFAEELTSRIALAVDTIRLYREAQEAIAARDQFLSIASHELKTPLTAIKLQLQLAERAIERDASAPADQTRIRKSVLNALRQVDNLGVLMDELLDVAHIRAGTVSLQLEKLNLAELVKEVCERYASALAAAACPLHCDLDESVTGVWDRAKIGQVLTNLISNVIKYAPGKPLEISLEKNNQNAIIRFRDYGPGIPKDRQQRVFERFERAVTSNHVNGLGLGLFITSQILCVHRGSIRLEKIDEGTLFIIELPCNLEATSLFPLKELPQKVDHG